MSNLAAAVALCGALAAQAPSSPALRQFMAIPVHAYGTSIRTITSELPEVTGATFEVVENSHEPKMRNVRATLAFDGVRAVVLVVLCCDKSVLESFRVESSAARSVLGEALPATPDQVKARFGSPSRTSHEELVYEIPNEIGADTLVFGLNGDHVSHVEWRYFID